MDMEVSLKVKHKKNLGYELWEYGSVGKALVAKPLFDPLGPKWKNEKKKKKTTLKLSSSLHV